MFTVVDDAKLPPVVVASPKVEVAGTCALQPPVALPDDIERGYRIEDERPIPVNGFCSFVAVRELPASDTLADLVAEAVNGNHARSGDW
jgi:hypothetical protein